MRYTWLTLATAAVISASPPTLAQLLSPSIFASIQDTAPLDGLGNSFHPTIFNGIVSKSSPLEARAVREFDLAHFSGGAVVSAQITGKISANNATDDGPRTFDFELYSADGIASLSDFELPGSAIGSGSYAPPQDLSFQFSFDVAADLQSILDAGGTAVGLRAVPTSSPSSPNVLLDVFLEVQVSGAPGPPYWSAQTGKTQGASPRIADLDGDGLDEIVLATLGSGGGLSGLLEVWRADGSDSPGFPLVLPQGAFTPPALVDLDGDGDREIVVAMTNTLDVFDHLGAQVPGWNLSKSTRDVAVGDIDGDGWPEVVVGGVSGAAIAHEHDGSFKAIYATATFPAYAIQSGPALGDIDLDGELEVLGSGLGFLNAFDGDGAMLGGFPVVVPGETTARPVLGDLDLDGALEIVVTSDEQVPFAAGIDETYALSSTGAVEPGWPQSTPISIHDQPSLTDLDGDGDLEIVVLGATSSGVTQLSALHHTGAAVSGFPHAPQSALPQSGRSAVTSADLDGDELPELVFQAGDAVFAVDGNGAPLPGFPIYLPAAGISTSGPAPAVGDIDGDGLVELVASATSDLTRVFQLDAPFSSDLAPWPQEDGGAAGESRFLPPTLSASRHTLPVSSGATIDFDLAFGRAHGGRPYVLLAGTSGTAPGFPLPEGPGPIPINPDALTVFALGQAGSALLPGFAGSLNGGGLASASLVAPGPLGSGLVGTRLDFSAVLALPFDLASEPVGVWITP